MFVFASFSVDLSENFVLVLATSCCLFEEMCMSVCVYMYVHVRAREKTETQEEWAAIYSKKKRQGLRGRGCRGVRNRTASCHERLNAHTHGQQHGLGKQFIYPSP